MFTGLYATLAKYALMALVVVAIVGGSWYGVDSIAGAFRDRTALRAQVSVLTAERDAAFAMRDRDVAEANAATERLHTDIETRDKLVAQQKQAQVITEKELQNARNALAQWRAHASPDVNVCLAMPLPIGLFPVHDQAAAPAGSRRKD